VDNSKIRPEAKEEKGVRFAHVTMIGRGAVAPSQTLPRGTETAATTGTDGGEATEKPKDGLQGEVNDGQQPREPFATTFSQTGGRKFEIACSIQVGGGDRASRRGLLGEDSADEDASAPWRRH